MIAHNRADAPDPDREGRKFGQLPHLVVPDDFDDSLPPDVSAAWDAHSERDCDS